MRTYTAEELKKEVLLNIDGLLEDRDKEVQDFYVDVVANLIHQTVEAETALISDKLAKMELIYDKLANIHSKQEEKYNKLAEDFHLLLDKYSPDNKICRNAWLMQAGLKEQ